MKNRQWAIAVVGAALVASAAWGQSSIEQRLEALEQEIKVLKRQRELEAEATKEKAAKTPTVQIDDKGLSFKSADGNVAFKIGGQLKADGAFFLDDRTKSSVDSFSISSARPILTGTLYKEFDFALSGEFGGSSPALVDAFVEWKHWPALKIRAGRFKQPFGLERLQPDVNNWFTSLGLPSQLVPGRDIALQLGGDLYDGVFSYAVSIGNGVVDGGSGLGDTTDDKELTGRLWVQPFKKTALDPLQGLGIGLAASSGIQGGQTNAANLTSYKTAGGNTFFSYDTGSTNGAFATGQRLRLGPQFAYYYGRLGVIGEYVFAQQEAKRLGRAERLLNTSWQVAGAFALTEDQPSYRGLTPKKPFNLQNGQWGALELVARIGQLELDEDTFTGTTTTRFANPALAAQKATAYGVGLNWYFNRNVRTFLDWDHTLFEGGRAGGTDRADEDLLSTRFQVAF